MKSNKVLTTIKAAKTVLKLVAEVNNLRKEIVSLKSEIETMRAEKAEAKATVRERNVENRKYNEEMIRYIFWLNEVKGLSGYKIAKKLDENGPFIYNILNRKIYGDVNIAELTEADNLSL